MFSSCTKPQVRWCLAALCLMWGFTAGNQLCADLVVSGIIEDKKSQEEPDKGFLFGIGDAANFERPVDLGDDETDLDRQVFPSLFTAESSSFASQFSPQIPRGKSTKHATVPEPSFVLLVICMLVGWSLVYRLKRQQV